MSAPLSIPSPAELRRAMQRPLIACDDLTGDMAGEVLDLVAAAVDKFASSENYEASVRRGPRLVRWGKRQQRLAALRGFEPGCACAERGVMRPTPPPSPPPPLHPRHAQKAAQLAKESLERKFGAVWHCIIGEVRETGRVVRLAPTAS